MSVGHHYTALGKHLLEEQSWIIPVIYCCLDATENAYIRAQSVESMHKSAACSCETVGHWFPCS